MTANLHIELYHSQEHAIISDWLSRTPPQGSPDIDDLKFYDQEPPGPIGLRRNMYGEEDSTYAVENAVARIALERAEYRLPQWAAVHPDGEVVTGRQYRKAGDKPVRTVSLLPRLICEINWADSGPGYSWPEAYHVTFFPGYDVYVVTASQDSPEVHGYTEKAIDYFTAGEPVRKAVSRILSEYWADFAEHGEHWQHFLNAGLISEDQARRIAGELTWQDYS